MIKKQKPSARTKKVRARRKLERNVVRQVTEFDPNGIEVTHHRTVDTLALMLNSGV